MEGQHPPHRYAACYSQRQPTDSQEYLWDSPTATSDRTLSHEGSNSPTISQFSIRKATRRETTWPQNYTCRYSSERREVAQSCIQKLLPALLIIDCESSLQTAAEFTSKPEFSCSSICLQDSYWQCLKMPLEQDSEPAVMLKNIQEP